MSKTLRKTLEPQWTPEWTREAVEARFVHWIETLKKLPDREQAWLYGSQTWWPKIRLSPLEMFAQAVQNGGRRAPAQPVRLPASPADIKAYEETSLWFTWLARPEDRRLVSAVAALKCRRSRVDWVAARRLARLPDYHYTTLRRRYDAALDAVAARLNGA